MDIVSFRDYCLQKEAVEEGTPFGPETLVFKVGKIFAICGIDDFKFINLKCEPERALELREQYDGIQPGWHMNKKHWNSVYVERDVPDNLFYQLIDDSYDLIRGSLSKKQREELGL